MLRLDNETEFDIILFLRDFDKTDWRAVFIDEFIAKKLFHLTYRANTPILQFQHKKDYENVEEVAKKIEEMRNVL